MEFLLLVDFEVMQLLLSLPKATRTRASRYLVEIQKNPHARSDYHDWDANGRLYDVAVFHGLAFHYWIDAGDRHVKVMALVLADR